MAWIVEDPTFVIIAGCVAAVTLLVAFFRSGRGLYLAWIAAVALVVLLMVLIERYVVTDRERVEATLYGAAAAVSANDIEATLAYVSPTAEQLRSEIRSRMRFLEVEEAQIIDWRVEFNDSQPQPKAIATVLGRLKFNAPQSPHDQALLRITVELAKEDDRWLVRSYKLKTR